MELRERPSKGEIYFYLNQDDEERLDTWDCEEKDLQRERAGVVFNNRKQLAAYLENKLCEFCDGYQEVPKYSMTENGNYYIDGAKPCICQLKN